MAKVLKFKEVNSDVERRMKDFEKLRIKFKADLKKGEAKKAAAGKESKGIFKSISDFFSDSPKAPANAALKK
jgi:DNA primase large subunit